MASASSFCGWEGQVISIRAPAARMVGGVCSQVALGHLSAGCPVLMAVRRSSPKPWAVRDNTHSGMRKGWDPDLLWWGCRREPCLCCQVPKV